jgi:hypothetical protein
MTGEFGLLGVPSSAAAHGLGRRRRRPCCAGLPEWLAVAGVRVADYGDPPVVRWQPDPDQRRPTTSRPCSACSTRPAGGWVRSWPMDGSRWCWAANAASPSR